jgi:hypothetical protein
LVYHLDITQQSKNLLVISFHGLWFLEYSSWWR